MPDSSTAPVTAPLVAPTTSAPAVAPVGNNAVAVAQSLIGKRPYIWGGGRDGKRGALAQVAYDCSSFVSQIYASLGFTGITAQTDGIHLQAVTGQKLQIVSTPQPGDLVLYKNPTPSDGNGQYSHVEIYAGNGQTVGAQSPGVGITQRTMPNTVKEFIHVVGYNNNSPDSLPIVPVAVAGVPGFISGNLSTINLAIKAALNQGLDPHIWLGVLAHESQFDPNAVNKKSGACGLAQIYPCISGLSPEQNLAEGAKRLKAFLDGCSGDYNCALNKYSGGGGQTYIDTVRGFSTLIKASNPDLSSGNATSVPIATDSSSPSNSSDCVTKCPKWKLSPVGDVSIPDLGCLFQCSAQQLADTVNAWWISWQKEHVANWLFVVGGFVVLAIGIGALVQLQSSGGGMDIAKLAVAA